MWKMAEKSVNITLKESTWRWLNSLKRPGESFDDVLNELRRQAAQPEKC